MLALARDRDIDRGALRAAELLRGLGGRDSLRRLTFDRDDAIARAKPEPERRRALDRRDDRQPVVTDVDRDAHASVAPLRLFHQIAVLLLLEEGGVRIQGLHQPLDGGVDEVLGIDLVDVLVVDVGEDLVVGAQVVIDVLGSRGDGGSSDEAEAHDGQNDVAARRFLQKRHVLGPSVDGRRDAQEGGRPLSSDHRSANPYSLNPESRQKCPGGATSRAPAPIRCRTTG